MSSGSVQAARETHFATVDVVAQNIAVRFDKETPTRLWSAIH